MKKTILIIAITAITLLMARPAQSQDIWYFRGGASTITGVFGLEHFLDVSNNYSLSYSLGYGGRKPNGDVVTGVGVNFFFEPDPFQSGYFLFASNLTNYVMVTEDASDTYYDVIAVVTGYRFILGENFDFRFGGGVAFGAPEIVPAFEVSLGWGVISY